MLGGVVKHVQPLDAVINANLKHIEEYRMQFKLDRNREARSNFKAVNRQQLIILLC